MSEFDKKIDMTAAAMACIDAGDISGGYTLVLLQQIRDDLRGVYEKLSEIQRMLMEMKK